VSAGELRALQEAFSRAVLDGDPGAAASFLEPGGEDAMRRLAIYRRAVTANLVGALRGAHPVIVRLVGDGFFHEAASRFARATPPHSGDLNRFGSGFADFLGTYSPAASMPWLADVARLEWACHEASMAADGEPLDFDALAQVPAHAQGDLRFSLHPSVGVVKSAWPILAIWEANQPDRDGTPDREEGDDRVLVWRESGTVRAVALGPRETGFVEALAAGRGLDDAAGDPDWDLPAFLEQLARHGVLGAFRTEIPGGPSPISP
jgi:hypothetical protein